MKNYLASKFIFQTYVLLYLLLFALSLGSFMLFRPFSYIDIDHSNIFCTADKKTYELGPNYIFAVGKKLDPFNDSKARKLCEHKIIRDYNNTYPTPKNLNYTFLAKEIQESSWLSAIFAFILTFSLGTIFIEVFRILLIKDSPSLGQRLWHFFTYITS